MAAMFTANYYPRWLKITSLENKNRLTDILPTLTGSRPVIPDSRSIRLIPRGTLHSPLTLQGSWAKPTVPSPSTDKSPGPSHSCTVTCPGWSYFGPPLWPDGRSLPPPPEVPTASDPTGPRCHPRLVLHNLWGSRAVP